MLMANRGELRKQRKLAFLDVSFHKEKFSQFQREWKRLVIFIHLYFYIKMLVKVKFIFKLF